MSVDAWYVSVVEPGRILADRYEILRRIAEGASSQVWEACDTRSQEIVAVKAVSMEEAGWRAEVRDRFEKEGRLLQLVQNTHLVGVRDRGETDDGFLYLVLDRLHGETLAERLARAPRLSWREAAGIAEGLAEGLAALHARGIVHRDLKPANVILHEGEGADPVCKIVDLGISRASAAAADPVLFATLTATGQVLGTPEYMSYEQALGERDVDARTDVWSLGAIAYEMLAGRRPFEGAHPNAVLAAIRRGPPPALQGVPASLAEVVMGCLKHARADRPRDGEALRAQIGAAIARTGAPDTTTNVRKWLAIAGGVTLVAASAVIVSQRARREAPSVALVAPVASATSSARAAVPPIMPPGMLPVAEAKTAEPMPTTTIAAPTAPSPKPVTRVNSAGF